MRSGAVRLGVMLALIVVTAVLAMSHLRADEQPSHNSAAILAEIGITPEALAIAGLNGASVETMRSRIDAASAFRLNYSIARAGVATTAAALTAAREAAHRGFEGASQALAAAESNYATALGTLQTAADHLYTLVTADLGQTAQAILADARQRCHAGLPPEFWVVGMTPESVTELREALTAERRAQLRGESLPQATTDLLAAHRSHPDVEEAVEALAQNLPSTQAAMND